MGFKTYIIFLFLYIGNCLQLFAQEPFNMKVGELLDLERSEIGNLVVEDKGNYYLLKTCDNGCIRFNAGDEPGILEFDKVLNLQRNIKFSCDFPDKVKRLVPVSFFKTSTGFLVLCSQYAATDRKIQASLFETNNDGEIVGEILHPGEVTDISKSASGFPFFGLNEVFTDSVAQYVFTVTTPASLNIYERINFIIYDEHLQVIGNRLLEFPDDFFDYNISLPIFSENGNVFFQVEIVNPYEPDDFFYQIINYKIETDELRTYDLKPESGTLRKAVMQKMESGIVGVMGYLVEDKTSDEPVGLLYYLFDGNSGELRKSNIFKFSNAEQAIFNPRNLKSNSDYKYLVPKAMHLTAQNHILLLFEYSWKKIMLIRDREGILYDEPYYYANEIFIFHFDAKNDLVGKTVIPKMQALGFGPEILGFKSFLSGNGLHLFFNDNPKNVAQYDAAKIKTMKAKYQMMQIDFDVFANTYQKSVFSDGKQAFSFNPDDVKIIDTKKILVIESNSQPRLLEITLN